MLPQNSFLASRGLEVHAPGHRRRPSEVKARIAAETLEPRATVNGVAECSGPQANRLSASRHLARHGKLVVPAAIGADPIFAPLVA